MSVWTRWRTVNHDGIREFDLDELAPLREDLLSGDSRAFYLLWLLAVENGSLLDDAVEPLPGIGPITKPLWAFAEFLNLDSRLVRAAAEAGSEASELSGGQIREFVSALPDAKKVVLLCDLIEEKPRALTGIRAKTRETVAREAEKSRASRRTAGVLRARAKDLGKA